MTPCVKCTYWRDVSVDVRGELGGDSTIGSNGWSLLVYIIGHISVRDEAAVVYSVGCRNKTTGVAAHWVERCGIALMSLLWAHTRLAGVYPGHTVAVRPAIRMIRAGSWSATSKKNRLCLLVRDEYAIGDDCLWGLLCPCCVSNI